MVSTRCSLSTYHSGVIFIKLSSPNCYVFFPLWWCGVGSGSYAAGSVVTDCLPSHQLIHLLIRTPRPPPPPPPISPRPQTLKTTNLTSHLPSHPSPNQHARTRPQCHSVHTQSYQRNKGTKSQSDLACASEPVDRWSISHCLFLSRQCEDPEASSLT